MAVIKALDADQTYIFMSKMFRLDVAHAITLSYMIFSLLSQILGLDSDQLVTEVMAGTICLISQSTKEFTLNFDQFMVDKISYQLEHFHSKGKVFNYKILLLLIVITENLK